MLKKRDRIIASIQKWQTRNLKKSHKYCIDLPKTVTLDVMNGNTSWVDAISKMSVNVKVAIKIFPGGKKAPIGHQFVQPYVI